MVYLLIFGIVGLELFWIIRDTFKLFRMYKNIGYDIRDSRTALPARLPLRVRPMVMWPSPLCRACTA